MTIKLWLLLISVSVNFLLLAACVFFAYKWIDVSISAGYLDTEKSEANEAYQQIHHLIAAEFLGRPKEEVVRYLQKIIDDNRDMEAFIFEKNEDGYNEVFFGRLVFRFRDDTLVSIER
jgi:hypothetical protein